MRDFSNLFKLTTRKNIIWCLRDGIVISSTDIVIVLQVLLPQDVRETLCIFQHKANVALHATATVVAFMKLWLFTMFAHYGIAKNECSVDPEDLSTCECHRHFSKMLHPQNPIRSNYVYHHFPMGGDGFSIIVPVKCAKCPILDPSPSHSPSRNDTHGPRGAKPSPSVTVPRSVASSEIPPWQRPHSTGHEIQIPDAERFTKSHG